MLAPPSRNLRSTNPAIRPPAPEAFEELGELLAARRSAVDTQTALKNQAGITTSKFLVRQIKRRLSALAKDIDALECEIQRHIAAEEPLAKRYAILISIPSFGFVVAATLLAFMFRVHDEVEISAEQVGTFDRAHPIEVTP